jgi:diguanylate cyclase (GGDEF)-like protein
MLGASVFFLLLAYRSEGERGALIAAPYLLCFALYLGFLNGFWAIYWPAAALGLINSAHLASLALLFAVGARFYRAFLQLRRQGLHRLDRAVSVLEWGGYALLLYPLLPPAVAGLLFLLVTGLGPVFTSAAAFWLMWRRHPQAAVFAIGWTVAHASSLAGMLRVSGALPNTDLLLHLPATGCALALLLFARAISDQLAQQRRNASEDFLTGAANRRRFDERGTEEFERARRYQRPLSLVVLDIDHFKSINDTLGHAAGDQVLKQVAERCRESLRTTDLLARTGGEEFVLLLVETGLEAARSGAERTRAALEAERILGRTVTASCGVAEATAADATIADTLRRADAALYAAKNGGRNRVCVSAT